MLIDDEVVAYWLRRAVELGDDDGEVISPRTILKASVTVFGLGWTTSGLGRWAPMLGCSGAGLGCCGLLRWTGKVFPLFFPFKFFCFIFWFEFTI
jgi:hypothetical protein